MPQEAKSATRQTVTALGLLVALFCAFFWLGFHAGKISVPRPDAATTQEATSETVEQPALPAERTYRQSISI